MTVFLKSMFIQRSLIAFMFMVCFAAAPLKVKAQTVPNDTTLLNSLFTETLYSSYWLFSGTWFTEDSVSTLSDMYSRLQTTFKFHQEDFENSYLQIQPADSMQKDLQINPTMNYYFQTISGAYKQMNPLYTLDFSLNDSSAKSYFTFTPRTTTNTIRTAFFILPGSNNNQTTEINRGVGYHNALCYMRESLKTKGDVFVLTKPLEDYRSLYRNKKKINTGDYYTPGAPSYIYSYLINQDKPYGINYLIEGFAVLKYLQANYDKVVVLGCSQGGYATLITTLFGKADASVMSSGYSIAFDNSASDIYALQQNFGTLIQEMKDTFVRDQLAQKSSDYLFTYGNNDSYYYQMEHDSHPTQNFFSGIVTNASFFYNYNGHSFPPCSTLDTFLTRVINKPKIKVEVVKECHTDSAHVNITAIGKLPLVAHLYLNGSLYQSYQFTAKNTTLTLANFGNFQFKEIKDSLLTSGFNSDEFSIEKDTLTNFAFAFDDFLCNSNEINYSVSIQKNQEALLFYRENSIPNTFNLSQNTGVLSFHNNATFMLDSVVSETGCKLMLEDTIVTQFQTPNLIFGNVSYVCDSGLAKLPIQISGSFPPFTLYFTKNNIADSLVFSGSMHMDCTDGIYNFIRVKDAASCEQIINITLPIQFYPLSFQLDTLTYNCDSTKYALPIHFQGLPPFTLHFRRNSIDTVVTFSNYDNLLWLTNGNYLFDSIGTNSCDYIFSPAIAYSLQYLPLTATLGTTSFDCTTGIASKMIQVNQGIPPYILWHEFNGSLMTTTLNQGSNQLTVQNGLNSFLNVKDSMQCQYVLNQNEFVANAVLDFQQIDSSYHCDSLKTKLQFQVSGNPPFTLFYRENAIPMQKQFSTTNVDIWFANGVFQLDSIQDQTCVKSLSGYAYTFNHTSFTAMSPEVTTDCNTGTTFIHFQMNGGQAPYTIRYMLNGIMDSLQTTFSTGQWPATNGNYQFLTFSDKNTCTQPNYTTFQVNFQYLNYAIGTATYLCDSNYSLLPINLQGNPPYTIFYRKNNIPFSLTTNLNSYSMKLTTGMYMIDSVKDMYCTRVNNTAPITMQENTLSCVVSPPQFHCVDGSISAQITFTGNPPFTLNYSLNGIQQSLLTSQSTVLLSMNNGVYQFNWVSDATACFKLLQQTYTNNFELLAVSIANPIYVCDSNKTKLSISLSGNAPYTVYYRKNGTASQVTTSGNLVNLFLANGSYIIDSVRDAYCTKQFSTYNYNFNYQPVAVTIGTPVYSCDSNKTAIPFSLQGNTPFRLYYTKNGIADSLITMQNNFTSLFANGNYVFTKVKDALDCEQTINQLFTFNYQPLQVSIDSLAYACSLNQYPIQWQVSGNAPFEIHYTKDGFNQIAQILTSPWIQNLDNGAYHFFQVKDATNCSVNPNYHRIITSANPITASILYDDFDCTLKKKKVGLQCTGMPPYLVYYRKLSGNPGSYSSLITTASSELLFDIGIYSIDSVSDQNLCVKNIGYTIVNQDSILNAIVTDSIFDCNTIKLKIELQLQGVAPFTVYYHDMNTAQNYQQISTTSTLSLWLPKGDYVIDSVHDNRCAFMLNKVVHNTIDSLIHVAGVQTLSCDSQKNFTTLQTTGGVKPYTYFFSKDGILSSLTTMNNSLPFYMDNNSTYYFITVSDSLLCNHSMNLLYTNNIQVPVFQGVDIVYDCFKDSNLVQFNIDNGANTGIEYVFNGTSVDTLWLNNGSSLYLPNGIYQLKTLLWGQACAINLSWSDTINNIPLRFNIDSLSTRCDLQQYQLFTSSEGKSPWILDYSYNSDTLHYTIEQNHDTILLNPGLYQFYRITDANYCSIQMNRTDSLKKFITILPTLSLNKHQIVSSSVGYKHSWYKNDSLLQGNETNILEAEGNGSYYCEVTDEAGCTYQSTPLQVQFEDPIQVYPNPTSKTLFVHLNNFDEFWEYEVHDLFGNRIMAGVSEVYNLNLDVSSFQRGIYFIQFKVNGEKSVFRFTKL